MAQFRLSPIRILQILLLIGMFVAAAYLYPQLPAQIPSHWGFSGQADGWMPKQTGTWFTPLLTLGLSLLLPLLRRLDPRSRNYELFEPTWERLQLILVGFFTFVFALQMIAALHPEFSASVGRWMLGGIGVLFMLLGNSFAKVRHNFFVGIRTPWTIASEDVWKRTHRLAGWTWVIGGLAVLLESLLWMGPAPWVVMLVAIGLAALVPVIASYVFFRQTHVA